MCQRYSLHEQTQTCSRVAFIALIVMTFGCISNEARKRKAIVQELTMLKARMVNDANDLEAFERILEIVRSDDSFDRTRAVVVIGELGPIAKSAVPIILQTWPDSDGYFKREAAVALGKIGPEAGEAVPVLVANLRLEHTDVAWFSAEALGRIGRPALIELAAIEEAANSSDAILASIAQRSLGQLRELDSAVVDPEN